ncbi:hydrolase [Cryptosporidium ubiquitum]|uniref:Hydrolase n=1 Tax=Cryptosporidium ubiquitum TaxID=857276 RepID=A0A1J4MJQ2_9CRYT|nr:hydrolase [Cryptosporidium ubiquitum]OII73077.1 hydrolase [Cryptosporidium ubiquitum]
MHLQVLDRNENSFSLDKTLIFIKYILINNYKLDFFLNDTYKLDYKFVPKELHGVINFKQIIIDDDHAIINNSIFTLKKNMVVLLKLKIDVSKKIVQLFPVEIKYNHNKKNEHTLIGELMMENKIKITDPLSIIGENSEYFNTNETFENVSTPTLYPLMNFIIFIWGFDNQFWGENKICDLGISKWYKKLISFKSKVTIHGILLNIPDSFILEYFESDSFDMNQESFSESTKKFLEDINKSINKNSEFFSAGFAPKFTWSTPTDAIWINPNRNICCKTLEDLLILLKASTKVSEDIDRAKERKISNVLLLREYIPSLNEMFEFRVFIGGVGPYSEYKILGISQRHTSCYYKDLHENSQLRAKIKSSIMDFFLYSKKELMLEIFDIFKTACIALDIYISNHKDKSSILIIDIQPLLYSSTLLFNIFELKLHLLKEGTELDSDLLRIVDNNSPNNMIDNSCIKGFVPEELLSVSNSDFYINEVVDKLEWMDYK